MAAVADLNQSPDHRKLRSWSLLPHQHQSKTSQANKLRSCCASSSECADFAVLVIWPRADLLRLLTRVVTLVLVARLVLILATVGDRASIAVVCVNAAKHAAITSEDVVDNDVAGAAVAAAVTAGPYDFAVVGCVEVLDVEGAWE